MEFFYQMDKDVTRISRTVYNSFMLLGDIGGLYGLFISFATTILGFINYQKPDNQLAAKLFKPKSHSARSRQINNLVPEKQWALIEYFQSCFPLSKCLRISREDKLLSKARILLHKELDLVNLLQ